MDTNHEYSLLLRNEPQIIILNEIKEKLEVLLVVIYIFNCYLIYFNSAGGKNFRL